jgi:cytochrome c oxidase subunit 1
MKASSKIPLLFIFGIIALILFRGIIQLYIANNALDLHFHDTYVVISSFHLTIFICLLFGLFAGVYYSFPKIFRRYMNEALGYIHSLVTIIGTLIMFWPIRYNSLAGVPRHYYDYSAWVSFRQFSAMNYRVSAIAIMVFAAQLLFVFNFITSIFIGKRI